MSDPIWRLPIIRNALSGSDCEACRSAVNAIAGFGEAARSAGQDLIQLLIGRKWLRRTEEAFEERFPDLQRAEYGAWDGEPDIEIAVGRFKRGFGPNDAWPLLAEVESALKNIAPSDTGVIGSLVASLRSHLAKAILFEIDCLENGEGEEDEWVELEKEIKGIKERLEQLRDRLSEPELAGQRGQDNVPGTFRGRGH